MDAFSLVYYCVRLVRFVCSRSTLLFLFFLKSQIFYGQLQEFIYFQFSLDEGSIQTEARSEFKTLAAAVRWKFFHVMLF